MNLQAIKLAAQAAPEGPYFLRRTPNDDGTVDIETGRTGQSEWPPAQNLEYDSANHLVNCDPQTILKLIAVAEAAFKVVNARAYVQDEAITDLEAELEALDEQ